MKKHLFIILSSSMLLQMVSARSKYNEEGEDNPYEFGFTIDGQQHRHEKKDSNGIIQGEYGFITADGIYHVTVYATDENGSFKILSMRNVRVSGPLDQPDSKLPDTSQFSKDAPKPAPNPLIVNTSPAPVQQITTTRTTSGGFTTQPTIKPACAGCGYVTHKPTNGDNKLPFQTAAGLKPQPEAPYVSKPLSPSFPGAGAPQNPVDFSKPQSDVSSPPVTQVNLPTSQNNFPTSQNNYPTAQNNFPTSHNNLPTLQGNLQTTQDNTPTPHVNNPNNFPTSQVNNQPNFPAEEAFQPNPPHPTPVAFPDSQNQPTNFPSPPQSPINSLNPLAVPEPSAFTDKPPGGIVVDHNTINVPGNPPIQIQDKYPGMVDGLPAGITKDDITDLLYKFNYTIGFHGHYEKGYKNGAKVGGYFVNDRDGVSRIVTYVADENGYRPKVKFIRLDLSSDLVPKEGTEKTFGLKNFEFVWYPIK